MHGALKILPSMEYGEVKENQVNGLLRLVALIGRGTQIFYSKLRKENVGPIQE